MPPPLIIVRLHPKESATSYQKYKNYVHAFSIGGCAHRLLYFSDAIVGITTTLLLEAAQMGKKVLSIVPRASEIDWVPSSDYVDIKVCTSRQGVKSNMVQLNVIERKQKVKADINHKLKLTVFSVISGLI